MLDEELQVFRGCRVVGRHAVLAVVVLNQQPEQPHEFGFRWRPGAALADQVSETMPDGFVLLFGFDDLGCGFDQKLFVGGRHLEILPAVLFMSHYEGYAASRTSKAIRFPSAAKAASIGSRREWWSRSNSRSTVVFGMPSRRANSAFRIPEARNAI